MRKIFIPLIMAVSLSLTGCGTAEETTAATTETPADITDVSEASSTETTEADAPETTATTSGADAADCDQFLTDYEEFVSSYASIASKYARNPTDMSIMTEYSEMATKAQEMQSDKPSACEADKAFKKRYMAIATKMSKAAAAQAAGSARMMEQMSKMSN